MSLIERKSLHHAKKNIHASMQAAYIQIFTGGFSDVMTRALNPANYFVAVLALLVPQLGSFVLEVAADWVVLETPVTASLEGQEHQRIVSV